MTAVSSVWESESWDVASSTTESRSRVRSSSRRSSSVRSQRPHRLRGPSGKGGEPRELGVAGNRPRGKEQLQDAQRRLAERQADDRRAFEPVDPGRAGDEDRVGEGLGVVLIDGPGGRERRDPLADGSPEEGGRRAGRVRGEPGDPICPSGLVPAGGECLGRQHQCGRGKRSTGSVHLGAKDERHLRRGDARCLSLAQPEGAASSEELERGGDAAVDADGHDERGLGSGARGKATQRRRQLGDVVDLALGQPRGDPRPFHLGRERRTAGYSACDEPVVGEDADDCEICPGRGTRGLDDRVQRVGRIRAGEPVRACGKRCQCGRASVRRRGETPLFG